MKQSIAIVGAGKVGTALAVLLQRSGYVVTGIASRSRDSAERAAQRLHPVPPASSLSSEITSGAEIVLITTRDDVIEGVCRIIAKEGGFYDGQVVLHVSGSLPSSILMAAKDQGCLIGSMHPLQSFADVDSAMEHLKGAYFCLEGDSEAVETARRMAETLGGMTMVIRTEDKPLYHAAAVIASNFFVSIIDMSLQLYEAIGIERERGVEALAPLIEGSWANIKTLGPVKALTGPVARGDAGVVRKHVQAIGKTLPELLPVYAALIRLNVDVGLRKGTLTREAADEILEMVKE